MKHEGWLCLGMERRLVKNQELGKAALVSVKGWSGTDSIQSGLLTALMFHSLIMRSTLYHVKQQPVEMLHAPFGWLTSAWNTEP